MARPDVQVQQIGSTVRKGWTCCSRAETHKLTHTYSRTTPGRIKLKRVCEEPPLEGFLQPPPGTSLLRATPGITQEAAAGILIFFLVPFLPSSPSHTTGVAYHDRG